MSRVHLWWSFTFSLSSVLIYCGRTTHFPLISLACGNEPCVWCFLPLILLFQSRCHDQRSLLVLGKCHPEQYSLSVLCLWHAELDGHTAELLVCLQLSCVRPIRNKQKQIRNVRLQQQVLHQWASVSTVQWQWITVWSTELLYVVFHQRYLDGHHVESVVSRHLIIRCSSTDVDQVERSFRWSKRQTLTDQSPRINYSFRVVVLWSESVRRRLQ